MGWCNGSMKSPLVWDIQPLDKEKLPVCSVSLRLNKIPNSLIPAGVVGADTTHTEHSGVWGV